VRKYDCPGQGTQDPSAPAGAHGSFFPAGSGFIVLESLAALNLRNEAEQSWLALHPMRSHCLAATSELHPIAARSAACATMNSHVKRLLFCENQPSFTCRLGMHECYEVAIRNHCSDAGVNDREINFLASGN